MLFLLPFLVFGQELDSNYYLVKGLNLKNASSADKNLIEESLKAYHNAKDDTSRLNALARIADESWDVSIWSKYNNLIIHRLDEVLPDYKESSADITDSTILVYFNLKSNAINNKGYLELESNNYSEAKKHFLHALRLANRTDDQNMKAVCYNNLGHILNVSGKPIEAIESYKKSAKIREETDNLFSLSIVYNNIGILYKDLEYPDKALEYYFKSVELMETLEDHPNLAIVYGNVGDILITEGDIDGALEFFQKAKNKNVTLEDKKGLAGNLMGISRIHVKKKDFKQAIVELEKAEKIYLQIDSEEGVAKVNLAYAKLYKESGKLRKALSSGAKGLSALEKIDNKVELLQAYLIVGETQYRLDLFSEARSNAKKALEMMEASESKKTKYKALKLLYRIEKKVGDIDKSFYYSERALKIHEEILEEDRSKVAELYKNKLGLEVRDQEIEYLNAKNTFLNEKSNLSEEKLRWNRWFNSFAIGGILSLILVVFFAIRNLRNQKQLNKVLSSQRDAAEALNFERETMLKEIHHRVKNNLQVVSSMLKLQAYEVDDEGVKNVFESAQNRIHTMALIHQKMYGVKDLKEINSKEYISELVSNIQKTDLEFLKVEMNLDFEPLRMTIDEIIPIGLLVNELLSNSMKHAFTKVENPKIRISMKKNDKGVALIIGDNGVGDKSSEDGLGKELISSFVEQIDGEMERLDEPGTAYKVQFSLASLESNSN